MLPWVHIDTAKVPGSDGELRLMQRGGDFSIILGNLELMSSRLSGSEEALATMALERLGGRRSPRILIGGLGMGFTLRAALARLAADARVTVAELVPAVVAWGRGPLKALLADSLSDPRVSIWEGDVGEHMRRNRATYDAILLDVDNGPEGFTRAANDGLYDMNGLGTARAALRSGGVLAVWSTGPDNQFAERLRHSGFRVEETRVRANKGRTGARHIIWFATKADEAAAQRPPARGRAGPPRRPPEPSRR